MIRRFTIILFAMMFVGGLLQAQPLTGNDSALNVLTAAVGDCSTDDTSAIQAAITATPSGKSLIVPPSPGACYKVTATLNVTHPMSLVGLNSKITQTTTGIAGIKVTASNVTISGFFLQGAQSASYTDAERAIYVTGTLNAGIAPTNITEININNNIINNWGGYGIIANYLTNFHIFHNTISNVDYAAIGISSGLYGTVTANIIDTVLGGASGTPSGLGYGIYVSRDSSDGGDLTSQPQSRSVSVTGNVVKNITTWEGLDTHAGINVTFSGNTIYNTKMGIAVGTSFDHTGGVAYPPTDVTIAGNTLVSSVTDGSRDYGIVFHGIQSGTVAQRATGSITGNTIDGYGTDGFTTEGAIYLYGTEGLTITGNSIFNPSPNGILVYINNTDLVISGNVIIDPFSSSITSVKGIYFNNSGNTGTVCGNLVGHGAKSATYLISAGVGVHNNDTSNVVSTCPNSLAAAGTPYGGYAMTIDLQPVITIGNLPECGAATKGARVFVSDAASNAAAVFHGTPTAGGSTQVNSSASCNGSTWQYE